MTKHTPGPWRLDCGANYAGGPGFRVLARSVRPKPTPAATGEIQIAFPPPHGTGDGREQEQEANARLIAAAPKMLAALEIAERRIAELCRAVHVLSGNPKKVRAEDYAGEIREAIKKATGQD